MHKFIYLYVYINNILLFDKNSCKEKVSEMIMQVYTALKGRKQDLKEEK